MHGSRFASRLEAALAWWASAAVLAVLADLTLAWGAGASGATAFRIVRTDLSHLGLLCVALAALAWAGDRCEDALPMVARVPMRRLVEAGLALAIAVVLVHPVGRTFPYAYAALTVLSGLAFWAAARGPASVGVALGVVGFGMQLALAPATYLELRATGQLLSVLGVCRWAGPRLASVFPARRGLGALLAVTLVCTTASIVRPLTRPERSAALGAAPAYVTLASAPAWLVDRDGDGFSPLLGDGDCDDRSATTHPGAGEGEGGADANCNGVRGAEPTEEARGLAPAAGDPILREPPARRVLLLTLDTFRPDVVRPELMPALHALVERGARFTTAYGAASRTVFALPYLLSPEYGGPTVVETMTRAGVTTATLGQGPPEVRLRGRTDAEAIASAEAFLFAPGDDRRFAWIHLMGLHGPHRVLDVDRPLAEAPPMSAGYVSEAATLDAHLAPLLARIRESWTDDPVAVVLTGDHGEAFGEHGFSGHTRSHFDEVLRVPLALVHPAVGPAERPELASARDVPPTLLGAFGLEDATLAAERFGRSLLRVRGTPPGTPLHRFVLAESARAASGQLQVGPLGVLVTTEWKLVVGLYDGALGLYDRVADPGETRDVVDAHSDVAEALYRRFAIAQDLGALRALPPRTFLE